jgi:hypothetical protein
MPIVEKKWNAFLTAESAEKEKKLTADSPCGILPLAGSPEAKFHRASADRHRRELHYKIMIA